MKMNHLHSRSVVFKNVLIVLSMTLSHAAFAKENKTADPAQLNPKTSATPAQKKPTSSAAPVAQPKELFPDPLEILKEADRARGSAAVAGGISWSVVVKSEQENGPSEITYELKVKGNDALAEAVAPARNKGEVMLFNDRNIWFFKGGLKKPVAISGRQKLSGQASNGDIASTHYARDYSGKVVASDSVGGEECWKIELKAKDKKVTYDQIRYWVSKKRKLGLKAEYLTLAGEVFKNAVFEYNNKLATGGAEIPFVSKMFISDSLNAKNTTTLTYASPKATKHADSLFNVNNLAR